MSKSLSTHPTGKPDEKVVLDGDTDDAVAFRAWVVGETRRAGVDGPTLVVSPLPEGLDLYADEDALPDTIHELSLESAPDGTYWCYQTPDLGEYEAAIFAPYDDELAERLADAVDGDEVFDA